MTINQLIAIANEAYPDDMVDSYFNKSTGWVKKNAMNGDSLAKFVVTELTETYDATLSDDEQIEEARRCMANAARELERVEMAFGEAWSKVETVEAACG